MKRSAVKLATMATAAAMASVCFSEPSTWIGGSSGKFLDSTKWDPAISLKEGSQLCETRVTNSVTFTLTTDASHDYWYNSKLMVSGNSIVSHPARFFPQAVTYLSEDEEMFIDVESGSKFTCTYMIGGKTSGTSVNFVKTGGGTLQSVCIGSNGNLFKNIKLSGGTTILTGGTDNGLRATTSIKIESGAVAKLNQPNSIDVSQGSSLVTVDGVLDCNGVAQRMDGLAGSGVITNAAAGLTLRMKTQGQNEFSGRIFGWLNVAPVADAPAGACLVIGSADTLRYADLAVNPTEAIPQPVKFKPGIGVFYVRRYPRGRTFYDTDGNVVELRCANHLYVDASRADDSGDGLTRATAYKTLAAALSSENLAPDPEYNIVHVAPGVYTNGTMGTGNTKNRVSVPSNVSLESDAGAEHTFIVGEASDNAVSKGCGPGAVRCAYLASGARIQGFTLTGGRTYVTSSSGDYGGGVKCADLNCFVVDCVISNNAARRGGGGERGTYVRTKILSNMSTEANLGSGLMYGCNLHNCIFDDNASTGFYSAGEKSMMYNCVFGPNGTSIRADGTTDAARAHAYNTIFMSKVLTGGVASGQKMRLHNCVTMDVVPSDVDLDDDCTQTNGFANAAAKFKWLGFDDGFRPVTALPGRIVDGGTNEYYTTPAFEDQSLDIGGNARFSGAAIDLGPYEMDSTKAFISLEVANGGIAAEGIDAGVTNLPPNGSITFALRRTFDSPALCTGFTVNGEFVDFEDYPDGWTTNTTNHGGIADSLVIYAVYAAKPTMWVDAVNGNDANAGYHPSVPKKTLAAAFTPTLPSGSVVYAAPGWYTNETMSVSERQSRVVVPDGVTLESTGGASVTFIGGESGTNETAASNYGCGPGAVRCVLMQGSSAVLRGFTCFGGRTHGQNGGGVLGPGVAEDCVFTNCVASRGGSASGMTALRRCRFVKCGATNIGSAINECKDIYNCIFDACTVGSHVALYSLPIVNCTFLPNNRDNGACYYLSSGDKYLFSPSNVINSAILCRPYSNDSSRKNYSTQCVFIKRSNASEDVMGEGSFIINAEYDTALSVAGLNADGSVNAGSPLIDAGSNLLYTNAQAKAGAADLSGGQRIYNRTIDIGACEYDWRGDFAGALRNPRRALAVTAASENVTTNAAGGVTLSGGDTLSVEWEHADDKAHDFSFVVAVEGGGAFTYTVAGGEPVEVAATGEPTTVTIKNVSGTLGVAMGFAGEGRAVVSQFNRGGYGLSLIFK